MRVVGTHLGLRPGERREQVRRLLAAIERDVPHPTVLMGDLNEWFLWGRPLRWLHAYFGYTKTPVTYPAFFPVFALDRIWIKPPTRMNELTAFNTAASRAASDHLPLRAVIRR